MRRIPSILVTGGAGYIGSHVVAQLGEQGERIVVLDNLSTGHSKAVLFGRLVVGDIGNRKLLAALFREYEFEAVLHFAARTVVPESVARPLEYYDCNTARARTLMSACVEHGVKYFIFSSTAAVYGEPPGGTASEHTSPAPLNPYGRSKLMTEWMLQDACNASAMRYVILRYFNVAGCDGAGRIGQDTPGATHLVKVACQHATGQRPHLSIYGTDYATQDGTCIRDYIHVEDLADAHLQALAYLRGNNESLIANCGYGHGFSVREVLETVRRISGQRLDIRESERRPGDMAVVVADNSRIRARLGWKPTRDDIDLIVNSALNWERNMTARRTLEGMQCVARPNQ
ncbi:UDP-glucose 4-epimerase GalE [Wenzhouxiangella sediminis]|jgi:UDP-glucose 4-epimerase|uniref:UDP-glucose 4-epimerase n=1 Tax=Wenzhouxiangella sediminis TaxID=1792836 RepID=A0A3E1KC03_9GAMM|nr:UDP-glucose 4-epimerase GalE [Wenzhouxiangella sediminis]MEE4303024.1 UDP-glucose 4-epimerase GalE [Wenzhouxiangella sp.]RFF31585.1 UDP-glucose 4-epimerase GalE [Wenzhouxiangella sediminis]